MDSHEGFFVGGFTFALVFATVLLWRATNNLYDAGERQIRLTRNAAAIQTRLVRRQIKSSEEASGAQIGLAKRSADIAEASLTKLQRAFVFPERMEVEVRNTGGQRFFDFNLRWKNSGSTPANDLRMHLSWVQTRSELGSAYTYLDKGEGENTPHFVGPEGNTWSGTISLGIDVIGSVYLRQSRLYFYGWVSYEDIFDGTPRHRTRFCWQAVPTGADPSAQMGEMVWAMRTYGPYNSMGDDEV